eukprot:1074975-Pyramimonas_sp.AAC.1
MSRTSITARGEVNMPNPSLKRLRKHWQEWGEEAEWTGEGGGILRRRERGRGMTEDAEEEGHLWYDSGVPVQGGVRLIRSGTLRI